MVHQLKGEIFHVLAKGLDHSAPRLGVPCGFPCSLGLILKAIGVLELFLGADFRFGLKS